MKTTVVIPAFNEAKTIEALVTRTRTLVEHVLVVDDGSGDHTARLAESGGAEVIRHGENRGKAAAMITGFRAALERGCDAVITLDGDGQHRPEDIDALSRAGTDGRTLVIAARTLARENAPWVRGLANRTADHWISMAAGRRITDTQSGFRLYPRTLLETLDLQASKAPGFAFEAEILIDAAWQGFEIASVPIAAIYQPDMRPSHYKPIRDTWVITRAVVRRLFRRWFGRPR